MRGAALALTPVSRGRSPSNRATMTRILRESASCRRLVSAPNAAEVARWGAHYSSRTGAAVTAAMSARVVVMSNTALAMKARAAACSAGRSCKDGSKRYELDDPHQRLVAPPRGPRSCSSAGLRLSTPVARRLPPPSCDGGQHYGDAARIISLYGAGSEHGEYMFLRRSAGHGPATRVMLSYWSTTDREVCSVAEVAIVTGASRGIGAATARLLGARGYRVCVNYRTVRGDRGRRRTRHRRLRGRQPSGRGRADVRHRGPRARTGHGLVNNAAMLGPSTRVADLDPASGCWRST